MYDPYVAFLVGALVGLIVGIAVSGIFAAIANSIDKCDIADQEKVIKLLGELGIKYEVNGNTIYIDSFECDGAEEFGISFWDGEYYPKGSYHEFWVVPCKR